MVVFAHSGHWLASLMYLLPVIICMLFLLVAKLKDRRRPAPSHRSGELDEPS